jgi:hypothetical protein
MASPVLPAGPPHAVYLGRESAFDGEMGALSLPGGSARQVSDTIVSWTKTKGIIAKRLRGSSIE